MAAETDAVIIVMEAVQLSVPRSRYPGYIVVIENRLLLYSHWLVVFYNVKRSITLSLLKIVDGFGNNRWFWVAIDSIAW